MKKVLIPAAILVVGALLTAGIVRSRKEIEVQPREEPLTRVRTLTVQKGDVELAVASQGTVTPEVEADLVAEISGRIDWVSDSFEDGGYFSKGQHLLRLDRREYELNVASAEAQLAQAKVGLAREEAEGQMAREEWAELGTGEASSLTLREPQLAEARARVQAAEATLAKAQLDLDRTTLKAPFSGRLRSKTVDLGEFVNRGTPLATLYSVAVAEIRLPIPDAELAYLDMPLGSAAGKAGPQVELTAEFGGGEHTWRGRIVRTAGEIDPTSRMVPLIAQVDDPYSTSSAPPLSVGLFVQARIEGKTAEGVIEIPRAALRGSNSVIVVDDDNRLRTRTVDVLRTTETTAILQGGLESGERLCMTQLDTVTEGLRVQPLDAAETLETPPEPVG